MSVEECGEGGETGAYYAGGDFGGAGGLLVWVREGFMEGERRKKGGRAGNVRTPRV